MNDILNVRIYSDGSAEPNPGAGAYATIVEFVDKEGQYHRDEFSKGYVETTNNRMELMGAIAGLEYLKKLGLDSSCNVEMISGSQYLVEGLRNWLDGWIKNGWKDSQNRPLKNQDLWKQLATLKDMYKISAAWVEGHKEHPYNKECDNLAKMAACGNDLVVDEGYTK